MATDRYDVIVVGAGLGGLAAGAALARAGLAVRVLERHAKPGGYAPPFVRGRFEFEVALHALPGLGAPERRGSFWADIERLGLGGRLEPIAVPHLFRSVASGLDLRVPADLQGAIETLSAAFPRERDGVRRVLDHLHAIHGEVRALEERPEPQRVTDVLVRYPILFRAAPQPLASLLYRELENPLVRLAVGQLWSFFGLPPTSLSLVLYAGALMSYLTYGASTIRGKSQALSSALAARIVEAGGEVTLGDGAARIVIDDGGIAGVLTDAGERLQAPVVVANANPIVVAHELIGDEHLPAHFLLRLGRGQPSTSCVSVHLGLARDHLALGLEDYQVFVNGTVEMEQQFEQTHRLEPPDSFLVTAYSVVDPGFSPPGTSVVELQTLADGRVWRGLDPASYQALKQRYAETLIQRAGRLYPELPRYVEVVDVSTPLTYRRYTDNVDGAIYGFAPTPSQSPATRLEQRGPIPGLWFAGAWTRPGAGFEFVIASGLRVARAVIDERQRPKR